MTRAEHLAWAKERARVYLDGPDYLQAINSMLSDLGKHPELEKSVGVGVFIMLICTDRESTRRWVEGFN